VAKSFLRKILEYFPATIQFLRNSRDLIDQRAAAKKTPCGLTLAGQGGKQQSQAPGG
jgi:hypothetical protein